MVVHSPTNVHRNLNTWCLSFRGAMIISHPMPRLIWINHVAHCNAAVVFQTRRIILTNRSSSATWARPMCRVRFELGNYILSTHGMSCTCTYIYVYLQAVFHAGTTPALRCAVLPSHCPIALLPVPLHKSTCISHLLDKVMLISSQAVSPPAL